MIKRRYVVLMAVGLVGAHILNELRFVNDSPETNGVVTAIEDAPPNELGSTKVATVQLPDGSSLRARLLPACIASKGQVAYMVGGRSSYLGRSYVVMRTEDPK
jgi:hypothetical protein